MLLAVIRRSCSNSNRMALRSSLTAKRLFFGWESKGDHIKEQKYVLFKTINAEPRQVYSVVSEIAKYQEFIPYCIESFVNNRNPNDGRPTEAGLRVGFRQYDEKFICQVTCQSNVDDDVNKFSVIAASISHNLFHVLYSKWIIKPHPTRPDASEVELVLRFKFKSMLYNSVSSIFAKSVTELVMKAFDRRVYAIKKSDSLATQSAVTDKTP